MTSRRIAGMFIVNTVLLASGATVLAQNQRAEVVAESRVDKQRIYELATPVTTSSSEFVPIEGLSDITLKSRGAVSFEVSGSGGGDPFELRVRHENDGLPPGGLVSSAVGGTGSRSFTFAFGGTSGKSTGCKYFSVEWRVPNGGEASIDNLMVSTQYHFDGTIGKSEFVCG